MPRFTDLPTIETWPLRTGDEETLGVGEGDSMLFDLGEVTGVCAFEHDVDETGGSCGGSRDEY